jgi:glycosyltransferase involved in cell wall biosynthesis
MTARRILHVVDHVSEQRLSGYSIRTDAILRAQLRHGLEPVVVTLSDSQPSDPERRIEGVEHIQPGLEPFRLLALPGFLSNWGAALAEIVHSRRIDILHAHSPFHCAWPAISASQETGVPVVYEVRGLWHESARVNRRIVLTALGLWLRDRLEGHCCRRVDAVVTISEGLRRHVMQRYGVDEVSVVPNGVDFDDFQGIQRGERPTSLPSDGVLLGYIGSVRRLEGLSLVVRALERMPPRDPPIRLVVIGDGSERDSLERLARSLGVTDRVHFLGAIPHAEVADYYAFLDVLVFPRERSLVTEIVTPLKPLEALAMGKMVLASDVGGLTEIVRDARFVFRADDVGDFIAKLSAMLGDLGLSKKVAEEQREIARSRDWASVCELHLDVYDRLSR